LGDPDGILISDETGFLKNGRASAGTLLNIPAEIVAEPP
jgi:hypothetical protein